MTGDKLIEPLTRHLPRSAGNTLLRRLAGDDVEAFHAYRSDPRLARFQGWSPMTAAEAEVFVAGMSTCESLLPGGWVQLGIAEGSSGRLIGDLGIHVDQTVCLAEMGFTLSARYQRQGHARRAVMLASKLIFNCAPVRRIQAITDARNTPSIALLQNSGFIRQSEYETSFKGERCIEILYALDRSGPAPGNDFPLRT